MASGSADQALSPDAISFVIAGKTWKVGDEIHSTGVGAIEKKKMVQTFGVAFATARAEGVFMGRGSAEKFRVKWTNLTEELILEYGVNHSLFRDPSKQRPQKVPKIHGPVLLSPAPVQSSLAGPNMSCVLELHPSSDEESEPECEDPQIPGISPLQIGDTAFPRRASNSSASTLRLVLSGLEIRLLMNSDLSRRFSTKELLTGSFQACMLLLMSPPADGMARMKSAQTVLPH